MSDYRTVIKAQKAPFSLKWGEPVCLIGSCFSENIGGRLESAGFQVIKNPFGIQYNPKSIAKIIERILVGTEYKEDDLHQHNGLHFSFDTHSDMAEQSAEVCLAKLNAAPTVIITLGTAWYYTFIENQQTVSNCFKIPQSAFRKDILGLKDAENELHQTLLDLRSMNSDINFILTLSPVRHWKDGVKENSCSKALLRLAIDDALANDRVSYFEAYEIMMDDLRDYRFYKSDMLHPNEVAVDYIWEHFCETYFEEGDRKLVERMLALERASKHRPRVLGSEGHKQFVAKQLEEVEALQKMKELPKLSQLKSHFERSREI